MIEPERWREIERLYHAARGQDKDARPAFLAKACAGDEGLRREVESLLARGDQAGSFLETPAIEAEAKALVAEGSLPDQSTTALELGAMISHYRLSGKLGVGGMGEVYRARDTKLGRDVALKILPEAMARDAHRMARFEREARTLALLNHPNIAAIHDLQESDSIHALVMELVEGETLAERISVTAVAACPEAQRDRRQPPSDKPGAHGAPLRLDEALGIARQIAEALEYAHERGIVHRDLKPANVKITPEGTVKVLDFGLAKAVAPGFGPADSEAAPSLRSGRASRAGDTDSPTLDTTATKAGTILGTPAYMSPEQARGQPVDRRTDIWAFGCVLYEMLAGRRAFEGEMLSDLLAAVLMKEPDWNALPAGTPVAIKKLVRHCLVKDPRHRLRDIGDARLAIEETLAGQTTAELPGPVPAEKSPLQGGAEVRGRRERRRWLAVVAVVTVVSIAALGALFFLDVGGLRGRVAAAVGASRGAPFPKIESIAVLPLENLSGDPQQEYFADGMTEELITDLGTISALRVISRTSVVRYKDTTKPLPEIARELNVDAIVEGAVLRSGDRVRITAQLIDARDDRHLWAQSYQRNLGDVLSLQDEVARAIADEIKVKFQPHDRIRFARARPVNPQAYDDYLKGMEQWYKLTPQNIDTALEYFKLALKKDPNYAPAYAGVAAVWIGRAQMGYTSPREAAPKAKDAAIKAVGLDPMLAEAHFALADVKAWGDWDWAGAEPEFKKAIELNPNFADARAFYSHYLLTMRRPEEGMQQMQHALDLDPLNGLYRAMYGIDLYWVRRYDDAIAQARLALQTTPGNPGAYSVLEEAYLLKGMYKESFIWVKASVAVQGYHDAVRALEQGYTDGGYPVAMRRAAEVLAAPSRRSYVDPWLVASLYLYADDKAKALDWLEKSLEIREPNMPYLGVPVFDSLRPDPRFQAILRRMNFPP